MSDIRYPYKPKAWIMVVGILFFGACAAVLVKNAIDNDQGLVLNGIIEFSAQNASIFYGVLALLSLIMSFLAGWMLYAGQKTVKEIIISDDSITAPKSGVSNKTVSILFSEISSMKVVTVSGQSSLEVKHLNGKLTIPGIMLADKKTFELMTEQLFKKVEALA